MKQCLQISHQFAPGPGKSYCQLPFEVPVGTEYIIITGTYTGEGTVDIGLCDAEEQIRGWSGNLNRMKQVLMKDGQLQQGILIGEEQASLGYLSGLLCPGTWNILLGDGRKHEEALDITLEVELHPCKARLVRGDIHGHSQHSDGDHSVETKVQMAWESGLDFLGFTDHNSVSQNFCLPTNPKLLLLPSCEITTYHGHVNIFGYYERRIPQFICHSSEEIRQVLLDLKAEAHAAGRELWIQLNHPIRLGDEAGCQWSWSYDMPFDWIEIWNGSWSRNSMESLKLWQKLLEQGCFLPAVGNSDFHSLKSKRQGHPCNNVWIKQKNSCEIFRSLAAGQNFLTAKPTEESFSAFCYTRGELLPFGSTIDLASHLDFTLYGPKDYLEQLGSVLLRVWNEHGLCVEIPLRAQDFQNAGEKPNYVPFQQDCSFSCQLSAEGRLQKLQNLLATRAYEQARSPRPLQFLRFELFSELSTDVGQTLLLSNPIFFR